MALGQLILCSTSAHGSENSTHGSSGLLMASHDRPQAKDTRLRTVQLEGHVILKIVKHCQECAPNLVTGQLLGLDVGQTLEVTDSFPFPVSMLEARWLARLQSHDTHVVAAGGYRQRASGHVLCDEDSAADLNTSRRLPRLHAHALVQQHALSPYGPMIGNCEARERIGRGLGGSRMAAACHWLQRSAALWCTASRKSCAIAAALAVNACRAGERMWRAAPMWAQRNTHPGSQISSP